MIPEHTGVLSNYWWAVVVNDYFLTIGLVITFIITVLKAWAVIHPEANSILCLFKGWLYGFPGMKKETTTTEMSSQSSKTTTTTNIDSPEVKPDEKT